MEKKAKDIPLLNIPFLLEKSESLTALSIYNDEVVVIELDNRKNGHLLRQVLVPIEINDFSFFMVSHGECSIHISYIPYHLTKNSFIVLRKKSLISKITISNDFQGYQIIVKKDFLRTAMGHNIFPAKEMLNRDTFILIIKVKTPDFERLAGYVQQLIQSISLDSHLYHRSLVQNSLCNIYLELWNQTIALSPEEDQDENIPSLHEKLALMFVHLLHSQCKKEHEVAYYAAELNVSSAHLTRVLRAVSKKTASEWISEAITNEIKLLLHHPGNSIQSIAAELNFSDQASLSKFFKKNTGMSPLSYRNTLGVK